MKVNKNPILSTDITLKKKEHKSDFFILTHDFFSHLRPKISSKEFLVIDCDVWDIMHDQYMERLLWVLAVSEDSILVYCTLPSHPSLLSKVQTSFSVKWVRINVFINSYCESTGVGLIHFARFSQGHIARSSRPDSLSRNLSDSQFYGVTKCFRLSMRLASFVGTLWRKVFMNLVQKVIVGEAILFTTGHQQTPLTACNIKAVRFPKNQCQRFPRNRWEKNEP